MYSIMARLRAPRCSHGGRESAGASSTPDQVTHITPGQGGGWVSPTVWSLWSTKTTGAEPGIYSAARDVAAQRITPEAPAKQRSSALKPACTARATFPQWKSRCGPHPGHDTLQNGQ